MPPRYAYWTIILEGAPTAFRAHTPEDLLPTLKQLQARHPDAAMKWFARGKLWDSPEQERMVAAMNKRAPRERRTDEWRPGGEHKDPRARFKIPRDEKRRRFAANMRRDQAGSPTPGDRKPEGEPEHRPPQRPDRPRFDNRGPGGPPKRFDRPRPHDRDARGPDRKPTDGRPVPDRTSSDRSPQKFPDGPGRKSGGDQRFAPGRPPTKFSDRGPRKFSDRGPGDRGPQGGPPRRPGGGDQRAEGRPPGGKPPWKPGGPPKRPFVGRPPGRNSRGGPGRGGPGRGGPRGGGGGGQGR